MRRVNILLVGSGRMGQIRSSLMYSNPKFNIVGVCDVNIEGAQNLAERYSTLSFKTIGEAIESLGVRGDNADGCNTSIDGVVICSPSFTHGEIIHTAASHRLPMFVEKPVDETADKIDELFNVCEKHGAKLCCGFQRRFDDSYVAVAEAVKNGSIGNPISANIFFADHPCPPIEFLLTGGDIFMDLCAHDVDYIRNILNDEVNSVYATGTSSTTELKDAGIYDNATMLMKFNKGAVVTLTMSRSALYGYDQRTEIFGTLGLASVGNQHSNSTTIATANGFLQPKLKHSFPQRFDQAFNAELDAFADTILFENAWPISREDCVKVQNIADAAKLSSQENRVVDL